MPPHPTPAHTPAHTHTRHCPHMLRFQYMLVTGPLGPMIPFQMGEARGNRTSNPRTPEPSNAVACAVAVRSIPPLNTTMGIGGSKGYGRTTDPCTGCSLLYTTTTTSQAFVVTGVCPSPESRMPMTPSGRGTTRCFLTPGMRSPSTPPPAPQWVAGGARGWGSPPPAPPPFTEQVHCTATSLVTSHLLAPG